MMDKFGESDLQRILEAPTGPCVSIYLPTHVSGDAEQQDPLRLKNLLDQAERRLAENWLRPPEARDLLKPARQLIHDGEFWRNSSHGLAVFLAGHLAEWYRLPLSFDELVMVQGRFHVKQLLPHVVREDDFLVLALSQNQVRLYSGTRDTLESIEVPNLPNGMQEALSDEVLDSGVEPHAASRPERTERPSIFHGSGGEGNSHKNDLAQYFRLIDTSLRTVVRDLGSPLLLAGVDYLLPIYRTVNTYDRIVKQELHGNWDRKSPQELHRQAWPLIEPVLAKSRESAAQRYNDLSAGMNQSSDIRKVVTAAHQGRIETLFVDLHTTLWGHYQAETTEVTVHETPTKEDVDLLDLAAAQTLAHRGKVYPVDRSKIPGEQFVAATYRY